MPTILLVDDEPDIRETMRFPLEREGFTVLEAGDGREAVKVLEAQGVDLMLLDLMMPHVDGTAVLESVRAHPRTRQLPVIVLTARDAVEDRIRGLELGADDYLPKPFSPREIVLRVRNLLERLQQARLFGELVHGPLRLDFSRMVLEFGGGRIELTSTEYKLIRKLMQHPGEVVGRDTLLSEVWGYRDTTMTRTLDTHVKRLREKLGAAASMIETIRGEGYSLRAEPIAGA